MKKENQIYLSLFTCKLDIIKYLLSFNEIKEKGLKVMEQENIRRCNQ